VAYFFWATLYKRSVKKVLLFLDGWQTRALQERRVGDLFATKCAAINFLNHMKRILPGRMTYNLHAVIRCVYLSAKAVMFLFSFIVTCYLSSFG